MLYYFNENSNRGRGRPTTTLPITLNNDLKRLQNKDVQLTTKEDLHKLQEIASQRQEWIAFTAEIKRTAEAARPSLILQTRFVVQEQNHAKKNSPILLL
ncbi:hypothetical protein ElyMa_002144700 [Elysia marginata]|uniref:Uncharacterized protein n=1 Tax=Elysia marginata TaxID=1093978 RepID=A0AAV4FNB0_9GAST|nr:hypothetical protein ElyMa_002144700 [Elysia marginata]